MKIVLAAVMHSPNLGDGVIAHCIDAAARDHMPGLSIEWLDLAGRSENEDPGGRGSPRKALLQVLDSLPTPARQLLARALVSAQVRRRLEPLINDSFSGASGVIIGGGQLLQDVHLNFPLKINRIVEEAERRGLPIALHGVGVSKHWTRDGLLLFSQLLESPNLRYISVRDAASRTNLLSHCALMNLTASPHVEVHPDPGFLASSFHFSPLQPGAESRPRIGLGITHPLLIRAHSNTNRKVRHQNWVEWYRALAASLSRENDVIMFTNGSPEDESMLDQLALNDHASISRLPRCKTPEDLITFISGLDGLAAHRLHALIVGHTFGLPALGFKWDAKLDAFFELIGQKKFLIDAPSHAPAEAASLLSQACRFGRAAPDPALTAAARIGVQSAINALRAGMNAKLKAQHDRAETPQA